jgi:DNA ligase (NAD+)
MSHASVSTRIRELAAELTAADHAYYGAGDSPLSDAQYDARQDELRALLEAHPELRPADSPLERVGAPAVLHAPVRHARPMLSLEKATDPAQVAAFMARFPGQDVGVTRKIDGVSLSLVYEDGRLVRAATRGDGTVGEDVTAIARAIVDGLPAAIAAGGTVEVRGEAVMLRSTFAAYNAAHPDKPLINPRNGAAGTFRAKDPAKVADRRLAFLAFDLFGGPAASGETGADLAALGFSAVPVVACRDPEAAMAAIAAVELERPELDYDVDGAVVRLLDRAAYVAAGARSNSPRGALAFKYRAEEQATRLQDVLWDVGKTGKVVPVAVLAPVHVAGTTISRATLANQEVIRARDVRIGDQVLVRRAGDVIPFVIGVADATARTGDERAIVPPADCPSCGETLRVEGNSAELFCPNLACPAQAARRLMHWASRAAADIEAIGPRWIERFHEAGLLPDRAGFYALAREDLLAFPGIGDVSAERMLQSIDASRDVGLRRALIGLAIPLAGEGTAVRLCRAGYTSIEQVAAASVEELQLVEDVGPKGAASLRAHLTREDVQEELARMRRLGVSLDVREEDLPVRVADDAPLAGLTVVITGAISDPRNGAKVPRPEFARLAARAGATVASSVSASTDQLITGADVGAAKTAKADKLGVAVVDQGEVWARLIAAGLA